LRSFAARFRLQNNRTKTVAQKKKKNGLIFNQKRNENDYPRIKTMKTAHPRNGTSLRNDGVVQGVNDSFVLTILLHRQSGTNKQQKEATP
jgi:hypothetical protein